MIRAKKSLGQNFLIDKNIIDKIINTVSITNNEILEVGPGTGNLTREILRNNPTKMYLVEKDTFLAESLRELIGEKVKIFNEDILKFDENSLSKNKIIVFGNLPYNISTEILSSWITNLKKDYWFSDLVLMFQKEVADRIVAKPNTKAYGRLSILSQWRTTAKIKMLVPPEAFNPRPKVQSAIVTINADQKIDHTISPALLERIVKLGFGQRRKMLRSSLKSYNNIEFHIKNIGLLPTLRAEDLSVTDWCGLAKSIAVAEKLT